jgi:hypothetical protein
MLNGRFENGCLTAQGCKQPANADPFCIPLGHHSHQKRKRTMSANESAEAFLLVIKRLAKWALFAAVGIAVFTMFMAGFDEATDRWEKRPYKLTEYNGIKLGATEAEVEYALGAAQKDTREPATDYVTWTYGEGTKRLIAVSFKRMDRKVHSILCLGGSWECPPVFGLRDGSTEAAVLDTLGPPSREEIREGTKIMYYPNYNVSFSLAKKSVFGIEVGVQ